MALLQIYLLWLSLYIQELHRGYNRLSAIFMVRALIDK